MPSLLRIGEKVYQLASSEERAPEHDQSMNEQKDRDDSLLSLESSSTDVRWSCVSDQNVPALLLKTAELGMSVCTCLLPPQKSLGADDLPNFFATSSTTNGLFHHLHARIEKSGANPRNRNRRRRTA